MGRRGARGLLGLLVLAAGFARAQDLGQLNIVSQPGVEVEWEGLSLGMTDDAGLLVIEGIPPGTYGLRLRKVGYRPRSSQVEVGAGERSVRMMLRRPPPPKPAPVVELAPEPQATPEPQAGQAETPVAPVASFLDEAGPDAGAQFSSVETGQPVGSLQRPVKAREVLEPEESSAGAATVGVRPTESGSLPPLVYVLGFGLLGAGGAAAFRWRQRALARAAFLADASPLAFEPPRKLQVEAPEFLTDLKRRETALENLQDAEGPRRHSQAIDVEVEVIDIESEGSTD